MARSHLIAAIDIGTDNCTTLIAGQEEGSSALQLLGVASTPSKGMRKSQIVDLEQVIQSMTESVDAAERMAGVEIRQVAISITGSHIASQNSKGVVAVANPTQEITASDVDRVIEAARAISLPADREVLHVIPHNFSVDSQSGIKDPIGMTGIRLETQAHIISAMGTTVRNLTKCVQDIGLEVGSITFGGLAAAEVTLTDTERELGVVLADIGAGGTSVCAYTDGSLVYSGVIPIGSRHITQDIALGCRLSLESAERIKTHLSTDDLRSIQPKVGENKDDFKKRKKLADVLNVNKLGIQEQIETLSKKTLIEGIMVPRMKELCSLIGQELQHQGILDQVPAGLVLTGGGAETVGLTEVVKRTLNLPARVGLPINLHGMIEDVHKPSFATSIGLLVMSQKQGVTPVNSSFHLPQMITGLQLGKLGKKLTDVFSALLP